MLVVARGVAWPTRASRTRRRRAWRKAAGGPGGDRARASTRSRSAAPHGSIATEHQLLEKWFRDIKVYDIFEGTGQIQRIVISKRLLPDLKSF